MSHTHRFLTHIKRHAVGYLALFLVLSSGTAYAANTVFSTDIVDGQVKSVDVADNGLTGTDIAESALSVRGMGCQAGLVHGFARVKGLVDIGPRYTSDPDAIDRKFNCVDAEVQVREASEGVYFVRFLGNSATLALATSNSDGSGLESRFNDDIVSVGRITSGSDSGAFRVEVQDVGDHSNGSDPDDGQFTIMLM